ncbi:MAG: ankyrin repeat domain-containing protein [Wolbachia sp.]
MARANEKANVDKINNAGLTPFHLAIHNYMTVPNYKKEIVEVLIENNADVNKIDGNENVPLHLAVKKTIKRW